MVPGHPGEKKRHSAPARDACEEKSATEEERQNCEPGTHSECQGCAYGRKRADDNLNLPHKRENSSEAPVNGKSSVDPGLCAAFDQDAVATSGSLELLDGFARPCACLTENVDGRARLVLREKGFNL